MSQQSTSPLPSSATEVSKQLQSVIGELRKAVDQQLGSLVHSRANAPQVVRGLARLEGLLDIASDYSKDWRPGDVLDALHGDLVTFNTEAAVNTTRPSLGAYLQHRPTRTLPVPDRHRIDEQQRNDLFSEDGVRLQPARQSGIPELGHGLELGRGLR